MLLLPLTHAQPHPKILPSCTLSLPPPSRSPLRYKLDGDPTEQRWLVAVSQPQGPPEPSTRAALLPPCLSQTGSQPWPGGWDQTLCRKATSPLCCWGQGLGTGMCWGLAAFLGWNENIPLPGMVFVSHGWSPSAARGAQRGQTLCSGALSPCLLTGLKCPLSWSWLSPGCVHPSLLSGPILHLWDQSWGPRDWPGLWVQELAGSSSPSLSSWVLFPSHLLKALGLQGCLPGGHSGEDGAARAQQTSAKLLALPLTLHLCVGRSCVLIPAALCRGPSFVTQGSSGRCVSSKPGCEILRWPGKLGSPWGLRCPGCQLSQLPQP